MNKYVWEDGKHKMRRKVNEIVDLQKIEAILGECTVGRFATIGGDGYPYIVPVNFTYLNKTIYFHCARTGEKMDNLLRDPKVCFEVDIPLAYLDTAYAPENPPCEVTQFFYSVIIRGVAELVGEMDEKLLALNGLMASHEKKADYNEITADMKAVDICEVIAIRIHSMTGKANLAQSKSEEVQGCMADYLQKRGLPGDKEAAAAIRNQ